jgi:hypothetical protein
MFLGESQSPQSWLIKADDWQFPRILTWAHTQRRSSNDWLARPLIYSSLLPRSQDGVAYVPFVRGSTTPAYILCPSRFSTSFARVLSSVAFFCLHPLSIEVQHIICAGIIIRRILCLHPLSIEVQHIICAGIIIRRILCLHPLRSFERFSICSS